MRKKVYKIIFMGTPEFSVKPLKGLIEAGHEVIGVYAQPPRPKDRGHKLQKSPVHLFAEERNIPVLTPQSFKKDPEAVAHFQSLNPDFAVVAAYGLLLPKVILDVPKYGCLNIHTSLLPRWRGSAPIQRAILAGDLRTGITIMQMDEGMDTGDILLQGEMPITPMSTASSLHDALSEMGADLIVKALNEHAEKGFSPVPQKDEEATHAPKLQKEEGAIDFLMSASEIDRKIRALNPWPGVYFNFKDEKVKIHEARYSDQIGQAGTLHDNKDLIVACGKGALHILTLQRPNKSRISGADFIRGQHLKAGDSLL